MTTSLHAHVSRAAADCDGPVYDDYVVTLNDSERAESEQDYNDFHDITFRERVIASIISVTGFGGTLTTHGEPGEWVTRADWSEQTEEGYRSVEVVFCEDDCDTGERHHRDVYAEMMGY